jgi:hypothetical protein
MGYLTGYLVANNAKNREAADENHRIAEHNRQIAEHNAQVARKYMALNETYVETMNEASARIEELKAELQAAKDKIANQEADLDKYSAFYSGVIAERDYAMLAVDELLGGADKNPLRYDGSSNPSYEMPCGDKTGKMPSKLDVIGLMRIKAVYESKFAKAGKNFMAWVKTGSDIRSI